MQGPNEIEGTRTHPVLRLLLAQFTNPIVLILAAATVLSMVLGDLVDAGAGLTPAAGPVGRSAAP